MPRGHRSIHSAAKAQPVTLTVPKLDENVTLTEDQRIDKNMLSPFDMTCGIGLASFFESLVTNGAETQRIMVHDSCTNGNMFILSSILDIRRPSFPELKEAFSLFEGKGKGKINVRDLGALLRCLGWNPSERDMEEAKRELEVNTRGHIPFADIERYVARRGGIYWDNNDEEDILTAFQALDRNGCGKIKVDDFKHFMMTMGEQMSQEEVEELVECTTKESESGVIDYKDKY